MLENLCYRINVINNVLPSGYFFVRKLGAGENGTAYRVSNGIKSMALKVSEYGEKEKGIELYEVMMMLFAASKGIGLPVYKNDYYKNNIKANSKMVVSVLMPILDNTLESFLEKDRYLQEIKLIVTAIRENIQLWCANNMLHGDAHMGNWGLRDSFDDNHRFVYKIVPFDMDQSAYFPHGIKCSTLYRGEAVQLMRDIPFFVDKNPKNAKMLEGEMRDMLLDLEPSIPKHLKTSADFLTMWDEYLEPLRPTYAQKRTFVKKNLKMLPKAGIDITVYDNLDDDEEEDYVQESETETESENYESETETEEE
jgi:hypothetical protein